jgi:hypothetical protein
LAVAYAPGWYKPLLDLDERLRIFVIQPRAALRPLVSDDDIPEARPSRRGQRLPGGVRPAGALWIVWGLLGVLWPCAGLIGAAADPPARADADVVHGPNTGCSWPILCGFVLSVVFLIFGIRTVQGSASGLLDPGICSLLLGVVYVAVGALILVASEPVIRKGFSSTSVYAFGAGQVLLGGLLLAAGVLATLGQRAYMEWRAENGLTRRYTA